MKIILMRTLVSMATLILFALPCLAGQLDDYYLQQYGVTVGNELQKAILLPQAESSRLPHCGTPLKHGLQSDWNKLESATQKKLASQLAAPVLTGETTLLSTSGRYLIHYATSGSDTPTPTAPFTLQSWVQTVADTFDAVAVSYKDTLGWNLAPTVSGVPYNVYLRNLVGQGTNGSTLYGQTTSTQAMPSTGFSNAFASYIEIDKDFTNSIFTGVTGNSFTPLQSLQITAAHEYHHAIQLGYNFFFDVWFAEASATWQEDELYDSVNQLYNYLPRWFSGNFFSNSTISIDTFNSSTATSLGTGYGRWLFNRYLAEKHDTRVIRSAWEKLATLNSPGNGAAIPMVPVLDSMLSATPFNSSLGTDYSGFVKRIYQRDWTTHTADLGLIPVFSPLATYSSYPVNATTTVPVPSITLPHYSFAFYKFSPSSTIPASFNILVQKTSGISVAVFKNVDDVISEVASSADGTTYTISGFTASNPTPDEVVLMVANSTNVDGHQASFSTSGPPAAVTEPANTPVSSLPQTTSSSSSGGGGGGCFIATAAYGSYLNPHVRLLRDFRDTYLLTNAPGRAFVALYYRLSPPVADVIAQHDSLRWFVRLLLTPLVFSIAYPLVTGLSLVLALVGTLFIKQKRLLLIQRAKR